MPADNKWFSRIVVAAAIIATLDSLNLAYPKVGKDQLEVLAAARQTLLGKNKGFLSRRKNGLTGNILRILPKVLISLTVQARL